MQSIADGKLKALEKKANKRIRSKEGGRLEFAIAFILVRVAETLVAPLLYRGMKTGGLQAID